jgi:formate-dependent phosphoribosylglycinamide formyltransferase (GAR transformylase)
MLLTRADIKSIIKQHSPIYITPVVADILAGALIEAETNKLLTTTDKVKKDKKHPYKIGI